MTPPDEFALERILTRLEAACIRLERLAAERIPQDRSDPLASAAQADAGEVGQADGLGEAASPQAPDADPIEAERQANEWIAAQVWRHEETRRKWEAQGGPNDEDLEAYLSAWSR